MKRRVAISARVLAALAFLAAVPACGGHPAPPPPPGPTVLFDEEFDLFPNPDWHISGSGTFSVDARTGSPPPSLSTAPSGPSEASLFIETTSPIGGTDLTFSADMLFAASGPGSGVGSFAILNSATAAIVASAAIDGETGTLTLRIGATVAPPLVPSAGWHVYQFSYDVAGNATWVVDGTPLLSVVGFVPPTTMVVSLENTSGAVFDFDTVVITAP